MIHVLLVDDERLVCAHLRTILEQADDIDVVGEAHDGADAVAAVAHLRPDVVLMDLQMPVMGGPTAIEHIKRAQPETNVVALTTFDADSYVLRAMHAGASGFLLKSTAPADLVNLVRSAAGGHTVLSPEATTRLIALLGPSGQPDRRTREGLESLTNRERDVLVQIAAGKSNAGIARVLTLSEATIKGHVSRILEKLSCTNRTQAGLLAHRFLPPHDIVEDHP